MRQPFTLGFFSFSSLDGLSLECYKTGYTKHQTSATRLRRHPEASRLHSRNSITLLAAMA
jgi:hypothetical protein